MIFGRRLDRRHRCGSDVVDDTGNNTTGYSRLFWPVADMQTAARNVRFFGDSLDNSAHCDEAALQIGGEIADIFQPDMEPDRRPPGIP